MKNCPHCAEPIRDEAIKCRWCGEMLEGSGVSDALPPAGVSAPVLEWGRRDGDAGTGGSGTRRARVGLAALVGAVLVLAVALWTFSSGSTVGESPADGGPPTSEDELVARARAALEAGRPAEALGDLVRVLEATPAEVEARQLLERAIAGAREQTSGLLTPGVADETSDAADSVEQESAPRSTPDPSLAVATETRPASTRAARPSLATVLETELTMWARRAAWIRRGPGRETELAGESSAGQELRVTGRRGAWYRLVPDEGGERWIHRSVVVGELPTAADGGSALQVAPEPPLVEPADLLKPVGRDP
jgi:uncharacterized protein YgiM (DUF1202 family)